MTSSWTTCACSWCAIPSQFDVLVLPNLYGDIFPICAPGWSADWESLREPISARIIAVFEPTHGSAPKYAGQNKVNPMATMLSGMLMLRHLKEFEAADRLEKAIAGGHCRRQVCHL